MHIGHAYCIETAAKECDQVIVIIFINGDDESIILENNHSEELLPENRIRQVERVCSQYDNVEYRIIDVNQCKDSDGRENWDLETPLVRKYLPRIDYVYSSEPSYGEYFNRAYPEAEHRIVDASRVIHPISSTLIRKMKSIEERQLWMV